jgi:hypothetical protein
MSGLSLTRAVQQALADRRRVPSDAIAVHARDGEMLLRRTVGSPLQRLEAARTARSVRRVRDQLAARVMGELRPPIRLAGEPDPPRVPQQTPTGRPETVPPHHQREARQGSRLSQQSEPGDLSPDPRRSGHAHGHHA